MKTKLFFFSFSHMLLQKMILLKTHCYQIGRQSSKWAACDSNAITFYVVHSTNPTNTSELGSEDYYPQQHLHFLSRPVHWFKQVPTVTMGFAYNSYNSLPAIRKMWHARPCTARGISRKLSHSPIHSLNRLHLKPTRCMALTLHCIKHTKCSNLWLWLTQGYFGILQLRVTLRS